MLATLGTLTQDETWTGRIVSVLQSHEAGGILLGLALCAVPVSIAVTESLLAMVLVLRIVSLARSRSGRCVPRVFWFWLLWAALECVSWLRSPDLRAGWGEIRHLLLIGTVFFVLPAQRSARGRVAVWRGIFLTATLSSTVLIIEFFVRLYRWQAAAAPDPAVYLRSGGLLNHWMIYGTVEILVISGFLEFWRLYPEERRRILPMLLVNGLAIALSLTRMLWICSLLLLAVHLIWRRSRWIWAVPVLPLALFFLGPGAVRSRITESVRPDYYSNTERLQMLRVGWEMIRQAPLTGVGAGRVEQLYTSYLSKADPVPAYHGHLHNNAAELAAEFGLPTVAAALVFLAVLFGDLRKRLRDAPTREEMFLCRAGLLALVGFLASGLFDYTYGHALGLILLTFVVYSPLMPVDESLAQRATAVDPAGTILCATDRVLGGMLAMVSLPVVAAAIAYIRVASGRSPLVAHLRIGQHGRPIWIWKLRTMWTSDPRLEEETGWVQRIVADPVCDWKAQNDPRITSRFATFCRRHSIDELPQLWHVLRGEMSLVGPRPLTQIELARHYGSRAHEVLSLKPGLTGYWQTQGRNRLSYAERVEHDLRLVRDFSSRTYVQVLLQTIPEVVSGRNAW